MNLASHLLVGERLTILYSLPWCHTLASIFLLKQIKAWHIVRVIFLSSSSSSLGFSFYMGHFESRPWTTVKGRCNLDMAVLALKMSFGENYWYLNFFDTWMKLTYRCSSSCAKPSMAKTGPQIGLFDLFFKYYWPQKLYQYFSSLESDDLMYTTSE